MRSLWRTLGRWRRSGLTSQRPALAQSAGWRVWLWRLLFALVLLGAGVWLGWQRPWDAWLAEPVTAQKPNDAERAARIEAQLAAVLAREALLTQKLRIGEAERAAQVNELKGLRGQLSLQNEALVFLQTVLQANERGRAVNVAVCNLLPAAGDKFHYRALLVQGMNRDADYAGRARVAVQYRVGNGAGAIWNSEPQPIKLRHYGRLEGDVRLPKGAQPRQLEVQVFSNDDKLVAACQQKLGDS